MIDKSGHFDLRRRPRRASASATASPSTWSAGADESGTGRDIVITESDITSLLRAKAAIYAGYSVLCRSVGVELADVEQILIGGAFGQYINVEKAIRIGLLPDLPSERFHFLGNTSARAPTWRCCASRCDARWSTSRPR